MPDLSSAKSGAMNLVKGGWHPDKNDKGKEIWHRPTQWGAAGREEKRRTQAAHSHVSQPLTQLQDPSSFGAPPKRGDSWKTGGDGAAEAGAASTSRAQPPPVLPQTSSAFSQQPGTNQAEAAVPQQPQPSTSRPGPAVPPRTGTGLSTKSAPSSARYGTRAEADEPAEPSGPFRADTTGLSTANLPPPPVHRDRRAPGSPPAKSGSTSTSSFRSPPAPARNAKPFVPTRNPAPTVSRTANPPPPSVKPKPNLPPRGAVAGGKNEDPDVYDDPPPPYSAKPNPVTNAAPSVSELQQRFARMNTAQEEGGDAEAASGSADADALAGGGAPPPVPMGTKPR